MYFSSYAEWWDQLVLASSMRVYRIKLQQHNKIQPTIPVSTHIITVHNSLMFAAQFGRETFCSKPLLIISEGCCSLLENVPGLEWKYITVHGRLSSDFFENYFGNWLNFLDLCSWKWLQHIWQAFALCKSNFLERHPHVLSVKYSSCFSTTSLHPNLPPLLLQPPSFSFPPPLSAV